MPQINKCSIGVHPICGYEGLVFSWSVCFIQYVLFFNCFLNPYYGKFVFVFMYSLPQHLCYAEGCSVFKKCTHKLCVRLSIHILNSILYYSCNILLKCYYTSPICLCMLDNVWLYIAHGNKSNLKAV